VVGEVVPDLLVRKGNAVVLIECKLATEAFEQADFDQLRRYLRAYGREAVGLLLGFGGKRLAFRRVTMARQRQMMTREEVG
jgi:Holliday junction resolvase